MILYTCINYTEVNWLCNWVWLTSLVYVEINNVHVSQTKGKASTAKQLNVPGLTLTPVHVNWTLQP